MANDFLIAINIRCEIEEFIKLLDKAQISFFDHRVEKPKIYYDEQTYIVFDTNETRQTLIEKINNFPEIKKEINEINFCKRY